MEVSLYRDPRVADLLIGIAEFWWQIFLNLLRINNSRSYYGAQRLTRQGIKFWSTKKYLKYGFKILNKNIIVNHIWWRQKYVYNYNWVNILPFDS